MCTVKVNFTTTPFVDDLFCTTYALFTSGQKLSLRVFFMKADFFWSFVLWCLLKMLLTIRVNTSSNRRKNVSFCILFSSSDSTKITVSSANPVVVEGESVSLDCNATGIPAPNVTWTKDGNNSVLYQGERYTIDSITRQQAGRYICTAENGIGSKLNATFAVIVHCKL